MFSLFQGNKVTVTYINDITGEIVGKSKVTIDSLPEDFGLPTQISLGEDQYFITAAEPLHRLDYSQTKSLTLYLRAVEKMDPASIRFTVPTISNEIAPAGKKPPLFTDFELEIYEDDWRQIEFLPASLLSLIQEEMADVEKILFPEDETDTAVGFKDVHVRRRLDGKHLAISLDPFCELTNILEKGSLRISGHEGYVENGFAMKSANYTYYGTLNDGFIKELCLHRFESADTEFSELVAEYELVLVLWCRGQISTV